VKSCSQVSGGHLRNASLRSFGILSLNSCFFPIHLHDRSVRSQKTPWPACRRRETGRRDRCACRLPVVCCLPAGCSPCGAEHRQRRAGWCPTFALRVVHNSGRVGAPRCRLDQLFKTAVGSSSVFFLRPPPFLGTRPGRIPTARASNPTNRRPVRCGHLPIACEPATPCRQISRWCIPPAKVLSTWANCESAIYGRALSLDCKAFRSMRPIDLFPLEFRNS
jgi:hypothetical protein